MHDKQMSKQFFLISFLPAIAYWYLEANYSVQIAVSGGLILATIELLIEKTFIKHIHAISKFNFFLVLFLGLIALLGNDGIWFKLQPFFTGIIIGGYMLYKTKNGDGLMWNMINSINKPLPPKNIIASLEKHLSLLFIVYGFFMAGIALWASTGSWLFCKTLGFYIAFGIFLLCEIIFIRIKLKKEVVVNDNRDKRF